MSAKHIRDATAARTLPNSPTLLFPSQKLSNRFIQKLRIHRIARPARSVSPQRRNRHQRHTGDKGGFISCVTNWKIQVRFRRHVQNRNLNRFQCALHVAPKSRRSPNVVLFPCPHLQNQIVGVRAGDEIGAKAIQYLLERALPLGFFAPQLSPPPLLREKPPRPHHAKRFQPLLGLFRIVPIRKQRVRCQCRNLPFDSHYPMRIALRRT